MPSWEAELLCLFQDRCSGSRCHGTCLAPDLVQVSHVEERKNDQIEHIKRSHEKAFNEIKNYYNDITLNNLAMIATLKEEIKEKEQKIERSKNLSPFY